MQPAWAEVTDTMFHSTAEALALKSSPVITFGYIFQLFLSLLIVIGLIYVAGRYVLPKLKVGGGTGLIKVLDRSVLEPQVIAYVLRVEGKRYVMVVTNKQVTVVDQLEDKSA